MALIRIIGCGNLDAGDDAVGILVVRAIEPLIGGVFGVEAVEASTGLHVLDRLRDVEGAILVDAVRAMGVSHPGRLVRRHLQEDRLFPGVRPALSTHGLGLDEVFRLAGALGPVPPVVFLGVEGIEFTPGHAMSEPVQAALPRLVRTVLAETARFLKERAA